MKLTSLIASTLAQTTGTSIALHTGDPGPAGTANEVSGAGYARLSATYTIAGDTATLDAPVTFGPAGADWGTITHVTVRDSSGDGLWSGALDVAKTVQLGDELKLPAGTGLTIEET